MSNTFTVMELPVASIVPNPRARELDRAMVATIADSIEKTGLMQPIIVRPVKEFRGQTSYQIIAGHHRFKALVDVLKRQTVVCAVGGLSDLEAELAEIDENLLRAALTPTQEAKAHSRRKEIYLELYPETRAGVAGAAARHGHADDKLSYAASTAQTMGKTPRTIERHVARGGAMSDEVAAKISKTSLDSGVELDAFVKLPPEEQAALADRAAAGERVSAREHRPDAGEAASHANVVSAAEFGEAIFQRGVALIEDALASCSPRRAAELADVINTARARTYPAHLISDIIDRAAHLLSDALLRLARDVPKSELDTDVLFGPRLPPHLRPPKLRPKRPGYDAMVEPATDVKAAVAQPHEEGTG